MTSLKILLIPAVLGALSGCAKVVINNPQQSSVNAFKVSVVDLSNPVPGYSVVNAAGISTGDGVMLQATLGDPTQGMVVQSATAQLQPGPPQEAQQ